MGERADQLNEQSPEEIRADIEATRAEMGETIDAIQERLSPEQIKENVRQQTIGRAEEFTHEASERARETGSKIAEKAKPVLEQVQSKAGPLGDQVQEQIRRGQARFQELQEENPRVAAALPIGILVALVLLWILLRRGSEQPDVEETHVFNTRVYKTPLGHVVTLRPRRK
jgi:ElaB/YqjD/DUF883 family membrane-anchored ribosome-binding protein